MQRVLSDGSAGRRKAPRSVARYPVRAQQDQNGSALGRAVAFASDARRRIRGTRRSHPPSPEGSGGSDRALLQAKARGSKSAAGVSPIALSVSTKWTARRGWTLLLAIEDDS